MSEHFTDAELACRASGKVIMAPGFRSALNDLRAEFGEPMRVTSACRTPEHNASVGGNPRSLHMIGNPHYVFDGRPLDTCAVDIATPDGAYRARLIRMALLRGWSVGVAKTFTHLDLRTRYTGMPQQVFTY
jgi:hypothetical protein